MKKVYSIMPYITGIVLVIAFKMIGIIYFYLKGLDKVMESTISFSSIVIGFYSAFYGIMVSLSDANVMKRMKGTRYEKIFKYQLYLSLISSFLILILSMIFQILLNYKNQYIQYYFYVWLFVFGVFVVFSIQTSILSLGMIFNATPKKANILD